MIGSHDRGLSADLAKKIREAAKQKAWVNYGPALVDLIRREDPNVFVLTEGCMLLEVEGGFTYGEIKFVRELLQPLIEAALVQESIAAQRQLSESNDRLGRKMLLVAIVGAALTAVGVVATIISAVARG